MYGPYHSTREKAGKDSLCFLLGLLSFLFCPCLPPLAPVLGAISLFFGISVIRSGEKASWQLCFGIALAVLGILFGVFLTALLIFALITKNPTSIYGIYLIFSK